MEQGDNLPRVGRPLADIDADVVRDLAGLGCSQSEIAAFFGVGQATISRRFGSIFQLGRSEFKIFIRRNQAKRAAAGSDAMLIHLGKSALGQRDKLKTEGSKSGGASAPHEIKVEFVDAPERSDSDPAS